MSPEELTYYRERAAIERRCSEAATDPRAKEIHAELAGLYEALVELERDQVPDLRLVETLRPSTA